MAKSLVTIVTWYLLYSVFINVYISAEQYNLSYNGYEANDFKEIKTSEVQFTQNNIGTQNKTQYYYKKHENQETPIRDDIVELSKSNPHIKMWSNLGESHLNLPEMKINSEESTYMYRMFGGSGLAVSSLAALYKWCSKKGSSDNSSFSTSETNFQRDDTVITIAEE